VRILTKCSPWVRAGEDLSYSGQKTGARKGYDTQVKSLLAPAKALNGIEPSKKAA